MVPFIGKLVSAQLAKFGTVVMVSDLFCVCMVFLALLSGVFLVKFILHAFVILLGVKKGVKKGVKETLTTTIASHQLPDYFPAGYPVSALSGAYGRLSSLSPASGTTTGYPLKKQHSSQ